MESLISEINARLRGTSGRLDDPDEGPASPPNADDGAGEAPGHLRSAPQVPPLSTLPPLSRSIDHATGGNGLPGHHPRPLPLWLDPMYAKHIVKGNFMTLSSRPKTVEEGEWIAHHVVEHYRLLWSFVRIVIEREDDGAAICNCSKMSAGLHSYTWLNSRQEPVELPAHEYMMLMQRWISGKIDNDAVFPTDPSSVSYAQNPSLSNGHSGGPDDWVGKRSGFSKDFSSICRTMFIQMFRVYAHLYWSHFTEPFYLLNLEKQLNSCFSHFLLTAMSLEMLKAPDLEPMQLLIDLWAANGTFPPESKVYGFANLKNGQHLLNLKSAPRAI